MRPHCSHPRLTMESESTTAPDPRLVRYTLDEEVELLQFLLQHKAEAGDGKNFVAKTFTAAAAHLSKKFPGIKPPRSAAGCKSKYTTVRNSIDYFCDIL